MKAWKYESDMRKTACPGLSHESTWMNSVQLDIFPNKLVELFWKSKVPGSSAPECLMAGAIQSTENMGRDVVEAEKLFEKGLELLDEGRIDLLKPVTSSIFKSLREATIISDHPYHSYMRPLDWQSISVDFPDDNTTLKTNLYDRILGGWLGQIAGASMGTKFEGYTGEMLEKSFGTQLGYYVGTPDTYNDDITYEIAFLQALKENDILTSEKISFKWLELIPFGWSAEYIALENLKAGIFPPQSGEFNNPFQEWIGAQMRCMVHGLLRPGRPKEAAYLAYLDSRISHSGNGLYGGVHSAVMTSLAFLHNDVRDLVKESTKYVPRDTEFEHVLTDIINECERNNTWRNVKSSIEKRFEKYNWIHVYPNLCCVITSLWYGEGDFDKTMYIVSSLGYDVDCNAGEIGTILGVMKGADGLPNRWIAPLGNILQTYVKGFENIEITNLARLTVDLVAKAETLF